MGRKDSGNGEAAGQPTEGKLQRILGKAKSEKTQQEAFNRTHNARERSRQARVRAQKERKDKKDK